MFTFCKSKAGKIAAAGLALLALHTAAQASPILLVTNGILTGAQGITVLGQQYDVVFSDVIPLAGDHPFTTLASAQSASAALDTFVFQGLYDLSPGLTNGCSDSGTCFVVTPYNVLPLYVYGSAFANTNTQWVDMMLAYTVATRAPSSPLVTYAHWSVHVDRQVVPEPSTLLLAGAGLVALLVRRKAAQRDA